MATLAESLLADFDDSDGEDVHEEHHEGEEEEGEPEPGMDLDDLDDLDEAGLMATRVKHIAKVRTAEDTVHALHQIDMMLNGSYIPTHAAGPVEEDPEYKLIVKSNNLITDIDEEIVAIFRFVTDIYSKKFPELEQLVPHPLDYVRSAKAIGNTMDLTQVPDLDHILTNATVMILTVTATTTNGKPLDAEDLERCMEGCDEILALEAAKTKILQFVVSRMEVVAPNVTELVGPTIGAKLMGIAGGLTALCKIPANYIQVLGQKSRNVGGLSTAGRQHQGLVFTSSLVQGCPKPLQMKVCRIVAGRLALCARADAFRTTAVGSNALGVKFREEILKKIDVLQEPPAPKQAKPLPKPIEGTTGKKRRGGRRMRKMKEHLAVTEMRKLRNRMEFGVKEETFGLQEKGLGMLGSGQNMGKLRVAVSETSKVKMSKKAEKRLRAYGGMSSGATGGLSSSLAFTPVQGLELENPHAALQKVDSANAKWFGGGGFSSKVQRTDGKKDVKS